MKQSQQKFLFILIVVLFLILFIIYQKYFRHPSAKTVTRIIHQSWKNKHIPRDFQRYQPSWKKCFPDWEYKFWTDEDNRNLVEQHYSWFLKKYDSFPEEIYRADVARYLYLHHYGGIYTDMDNECLRPFEHLLENYTFVFGTIDKVDRKTPIPENYVQNSFMYSRPGQEFWISLIHHIMTLTTTQSADVVTGPEPLCEMIHEYRNRYPKNHGIKIYDAWYFNPISWGGIIKYKYCKPIGSMTDNEWRKCREDFIRNGSFVLQYHSHVWG